MVRKMQHRGPLEHLYEGPYNVVRVGRRHVGIQKRGKIEYVRVERIKPFHGSGGETM